MRRILIGLLALLLPTLGVVVAVTATAAPSAPSAVPAQPVHNMQGHFAAFTNTLGGPDTRPGSLDITSQVGTVLLGRANLNGRVFSLSGSISPAGAVSLAGLGGPDTLTLRGTLIHDETAPGQYEPCIFEGSYQVSTLLGGRQSGRLVAVHQVPTTGAPSLGGAWDGTVGDPDQAIGRVQASFAQSQTGGLTGRFDAVLFNPQPDPPGFQFTMMGQAQRDGEHASYLLVGAAQGALVTLLLQPERPSDGTIPPGPCRGTMRLHLADGTVQESTVQIRPV